MNEETYYRITSGLPMVAMLEHAKAIADGHAAVNEIAVRYGAEMDKHATYGTRVEGLKFKSDPGRPWGPIGAAAPGYYRPLKRSKVGKEIAAALDLIRVPSQQDLAVALGCPPFFVMRGQYYCSAVGFQKVGDAFYISAPMFVVPRMDEGIERIKASEYHAATEVPPTVTRGNET